MLGLPLCAGARPFQQPQAATAERPSGNRTSVREELLTRVVTVNVTSVPLKRALDAAGASAGIVIQYQSQLMDAYPAPVTLHLTKVPLRVALDRILAGTTLTVVPANGVRGIMIVDGGTTTLTDGAVVGVIADASTQKPLVGVAVVLEGTKYSARTDDAGRYRISGVPAGKHTLVARRLGYAVSRQPVIVAGNETLQFNVAMAVAATSLEDVVTTMTGPQRRVELGNVVGVIKADSLVKEAPITSLSQLLTARVPGLVVSQGQGTVGGNVSLQIRGLSSLSLSTQPIVIVDGIRYSSRTSNNPIADLNGGNNGREPVSPLNDLNPNDVETIEVVKGPSAATLYGTDASDGVIVITTKRGKVGPPRWSLFSTQMRDEIPRRSGQLERRYYGWKTTIVGTDTIVDNSCRIRTGCVPDSVTSETGFLATNTTTMLKAAHSWTAGASMTGGQDRLRYYLSGTYNDQTGAVGLPDTVITLMKAQRGVSTLPEDLLRPNGQTLLNLRSNVGMPASSKIDLTISGGLTRGETRSIDPSFAPFVNGVSSDPGESCILRIDEPPFFVRVPNCYLRSASEFFARKSTELNQRYVLSLQGQAALTSWLTTRSTLGVDGASRNRFELLGRDPGRIIDPTGSVFEGRTRQQNTSAEANATALVRRGRMSLRSSAGTQYVRTLSDVITAKGTNLPPGAQSLVRAGTKTSDQFYEEAVTLGSYLEETVGLNERLFVSAAVRMDGASGFGSGYEAATYPKISASWLLSEEPFLPRVSMLDQLRLRAAIGVAGQQAWPTMRLPVLSAVTNPAGTGGGQRLSIDGIGNPLLRPERNREVEYGVDASLLGQRVDLQLTWYNRRTTDAIIGQLEAPGVGQIWKNASLITGHGFEAQLTTRIFETRHASLGMTLQHSTQRTKLERAGNITQIRDPNGGYVEGYPIGARFERPFLGYDDANHDGIIRDNEIRLGDTAVYVGTNEPPRTQQLTLMLGLFQQRIRLSGLFDRESGGVLRNTFLRNCGRCREAFDRTTPLDQQAFYVAAQNFYDPVLSGTFTRLREISAAIILPNRLTRALRVQSSSLVLSARNLALWTRFSGPDPESVPLPAISSATYREAPTGIPQARTWTLRLDLGL